MSDDMTTVAPLASAASRRTMLAGMGVAAGGGLLALAGSQSAQAVVTDSSYYSYGPYRYVDTRSNSGGRISGGVVRNLPIFNGLSAYTFACNITVVGTQGAGYLEFYNADLATRPAPYSSVNWMTSGQVIANFTLLDLGAAGANVYCSPGSSVSTHFIVDVVGFFINNGAAAKALPDSFKAWESKAKHQLAQESR